MRNETFSHSRFAVRSASALYTEAKKSDLKYGCVEVSLLALGGTSHLVDLLEENVTSYSELIDVIQRQGFTPNWLINFNGNTTGQELENIFEGRITSLASRPLGKLAGYLGMEYNNGFGPPNHVIAILPRQHMPRDERRKLKKSDSYIIVDTSSGGILRVPATAIANYANKVVGNGGQFCISQLWK